MAAGQTGIRAMSQIFLRRLREAWLPIVVILTIGFWWLSFRINPAIVPTWPIVIVGWFWMWLWWRVHNIVPSLSQVRFSPQIIVVSLTAFCLLWSLGLPVFRDRAMLRSASPDGTQHVVMTGIPGGWDFQLNRETHAGLFLDEMATVSFVAWNGAVQLVPGSFELEWFAEKELVALEGEGRYVAVFDYDTAGLRERVGLRHDHRGIRTLGSD